MNDLIDRDLIMLSFEAESRSEILEALGQKMIDKGFANDNYITGLIERENEFPTGVATETIGVALPHTDSSFVNESKIGLLLPEKPIKFQDMGGSDESIDVEVVFLLGMSEGNEHLQALQKVIELVQDADFVKALLSLSTKDEVHELLSNKLTI